MGKDKVPYKQYLISDFNQRGKIPIQTNFIIQWAILRNISRTINNHTTHETDNDSFNKLKIFHFFTLSLLWVLWILLVWACMILHTKDPSTNSSMLTNSLQLYWHLVFSHKTGMFEAQNYKELKPFSSPQLVTNF